MHVDPLEPRLLLSSTLTGTIWHDQNADGLQDTGEPGVEAVTVELFDPGADMTVGGADDVSLGTQATNLDGVYTFNLIDAGDYYLQFTPPTGYAFTTEDAGANDTVDSDADATGNTTIFSLPDGITDDTHDAGMVGIGPAAIDDDLHAVLNTPLSIVPIELTGNDVDVDGGTLTVVSVDGPVQHGSVGTSTESFGRIDQLSPDRENLFGYAVAVEGDWALIGAPDNYSLAVNGVTVLHLEDGSWVYHSTLIPSNAYAYNFGNAIDIDGGRAIIGAYRDATQSGGSGIGAAYIFELDGDAWVERARLTGTGTVSSDRFGYSVGISGDRVVVGASDVDLPLMSLNGAVYAYVYDGMTWVEQPRITASDTSSASHFGISLELDGDTLAVGARLDDELGQNSGAVYTFAWESGGWVETQKLHQGDFGVLDEFGYALSLEGDRLAISAPYQGGLRGSVFVFEREDGVWSQTQKLIGGGTVANSWFGASVELLGGHLFIGASEGNPIYTQNEVIGPGRVFDYVYDGGVWSESQVLTAADGQTSAKYGGALAADGRTLIVGASQAVVDLEYAGAVYVYGSQPLITFTPEADYYGMASFGYTVSDGFATASATVNVRVNAPAVAAADVYDTDEDTPLTITADSGVLSNDDAIDGDDLTAVLVDDVTHGTLSLNADGSFTYTPDANYFGGDAFTYIAFDGYHDSNTVTVDLTIYPVNDAPVVADDAYATDEDTPLVIDTGDGVLDNDSDVESDPLTAIIVADASHGTVALNTDGSFTYTPTANYSGEDTFTYKANDGELDSNVATVTIAVAPLNDPPFTFADAYTVNEDVVLIRNAALGVLANDFDDEGDPFTAALDSGPSHGEFEFNADGSFMYTPDANYFGQDSFTYTASDGMLASDPQTVTINVLSVNDPPVAADDEATTHQQTSVTINVLANDSDPVEGDPLTPVVAANPLHGSVTVGPDSTLIYTPADAFYGVDYFTYVANDGDNSNVAEVAVTVTQDLDIDGDGEALPLTDGVLMIRYLAGFSGDVLISGVLGAGATRTTGEAIGAYLDDASTLFLDVDGNGVFQPLTDGILLARFLAGFTGDTLTAGALGTGATRDADAIAALLTPYLPVIVSPSVLPETLTAQQNPPAQPSDIEEHANNAPPGMRTDAPIIDLLAGDAARHADQGNGLVFERFDHLTLTDGMPMFSDDVDLLSKTRGVSLKLNIGTRAPDRAAFVRAI